MFESGVCLVHYSVSKNVRQPHPSLVRQSQGFTYPPTFTVQDVDQETNLLDPQDLNQESSLEEEKVFGNLKETLQKLAKPLVLDFYGYANSDRNFNNQGAGVQAKESYGSDIKRIELHITYETIQQNLQELRERYKVEKRPLGPPAAFKPKKEHKNNPLGISLQSHAVEMQNRVKNVLVATIESSSPTGGFGNYVSSLVCMFGAAMQADSCITRALVENGDLLTQLYEISHKNASKADADMSRPRAAADNWWQAVSDTSQLCTNVILALIAGPDVFSTNRRFDHDRDYPLDDFGRKAVVFYKNLYKPSLMSAIRSSSAPRKLIAMSNLAELCPILPYEELMKLVKDKDTWQVIENLAITEANVDETNLTIRQLQRERTNTPSIAGRVAEFFSAVTARGMKSNMNIGVAEPGSLARKVTQRGVVPMLMKMAQCSNNFAAVKALHALGNLTRVKDCRVLLLQDPQCVAMLQEQLLSSSGERVSQTLLIVLHLMWDVEGQELFFAMKDPPIQKIVLQWAMFCMRSIIEISDSAREEEEARKEIGEFSGQSRRWSEMESFSFSPVPEEVWMLGRCLMIFSLFMGVGPSTEFDETILQVAFCCIDLPSFDHHGAVFSLLHNYLSAHRGIPPSTFPDPDHIIRSIINTIELCANAQQHDQRVAAAFSIATRLACQPSWGPVFDKLERENRMYAYYIGELRGGPMRRANRLPTRPTVPAANNHPLGSCGKMSGRLVKCYGCNKLEGKRGDFKIVSELRHDLFAVKQLHSVRVLGSHASFRFAVLEMQICHVLQP